MSVCLFVKSDGVISMLVFLPAVFSFFPFYLNANFMTWPEGACRPSDEPGVLHAPLHLVTGRCVQSKRRRDWSEWGTSGEY